MQQTLFYIPLPAAHVLLAVWAIGSAALLAWLVWRQGFNAETRGYVPLLLIVGAAIYFVLPAVAEPEGLPIRGYGAMLLAGVAAGIWLAVRRAMHAGVDPEVILALAFWLFLAGIAGARLFYIVEYWRQYFLEPGQESVRPIGEILAAVLNVTQGGLVVYGAVVGAGIAFAIFVWRHRLPALALADLIAPSLVLGLALGRVGCYLNGCCYGGPSQWEWPLAVTFPRASAPHIGQAKAGQISVYGLRFPRDESAAPVISAVEPGSAAEKAGLKPGDRVTAITVQPGDPMAFAIGIDSIKTVGHALVTLLRIDDASTIVTLRIAGEPQTSNAASADKEVLLRGPPPANLSVHPAQLYASIDAFLLCLFLTAYYPFRRRDGEVVALMLTIHPITRYLLEIIRIDEADFIRFPESWTGTLGTGLSISQTVSILILCGAIVLWRYVLRQPPRLEFYDPPGSRVARPVAASA